MMKRLFVLALLFLSSCRTHTDWMTAPLIRLDSPLRLGDRVSTSTLTQFHIVTASAQTWPAYRVIEDGIEFTVGVDGDKRIRYIATTDASFRPPEGVKMGDPLATVAPLAERELMTELGWGSWLRLPSGWNAFVDDSEWSKSSLDFNLGTRPLGPNAKVTMFFMRN